MYLFIQWYWIPLGVLSVTFSIILLVVAFIAYLNWKESRAQRLFFKLTSTVYGRLQESWEKMVQDEAAARGLEDCKLFRTESGNIIIEKKNTPDHLGRHPTQIPRVVFIYNPHNKTLYLDLMVKFSTRAWGGPVSLYESREVNLDQTSPEIVYDRTMKDAMELYRHGLVVEDHRN
ncbi:hypothetical protein IPM19_02200 [bacterium]|nr:MAG: hypothetical protein IPM19_02200 [bacterium]